MYVGHLRSFQYAPQSLDVLMESISLDVVLLVLPSLLVQRIFGTQLDVVYKYFQTCFRILHGTIEVVGNPLDAGMRLMMMTMLMVLNMVMMASPRSWGAMHGTPQAAGVGGFTSAVALTKTDLEASN